MSVEEFVQEINEERKEEVKLYGFKKEMDKIMKYTCATYEAAIENGINEDIASTLAHSYYYSIIHPSV